MKSVVFLMIFAFVIGGSGLTNIDAFALSCEIDEEGNCIKITHVAPALKQFQSGIGIGDIFCHDSYLVIKQFTGTPACVINDKKIIERGWAVTLDDYIKNGPDVEIILDQWACFGFCPTYKVTITNDGTLVFEGIENLETIGIETDKIHASDLARLISYINEIDYFSLEDPKDPPISDIPRTMTSVTIGDKTNTIVNIQGEFGIPEITELESMINGLANVQNRIDGTIPNVEDLTKSEISMLYVNSKLVDCVGVAPQQCMLVRENSDTEWNLFYGNIEGFEYQEGIEYKIRVAITEIENPPADGSSLEYTLVKVLESLVASCALEPDAGLCEAAMPRYYFDETTNSCQEFIWGGCDGVVPFESLVKCQIQCNSEN